MKRILLIVFVFLSCIFPIQAQELLTFHNTQLPANGAAYCIGKDDDGLLWIGSGDGLYCYDGYRCYRRHVNSTSNPYGIQALTIEGSKIYLGCDNGFFSYDRRENTFESLVPEIHEINAILSYGDKIYIGCKEGLWLWDKTNSKARRVIDNVKSVYAIAEYCENLLIGAIDGLYLIKDGKAFKRNYTGYIGVIMPDVRKNHYWIGAEGCLYYYNAESDRLQEVKELHDNNVKSIVLDPNNNLYLGTDNGLYVKQGNSYNLFKHDSSNPASLQNNIICDLYVDNRHNVWVGSDIGISMIPDRSICEVRPLERLTGRTEGNVIYAISKDSDRNLWLGGSNGLVRCDGNNADWYRPSNSEFPIMHNRIRKIYVDADGDVWILTDHGINLYDRITKKLHNYIVETDNGQYTCRWAYDMYVDHKRNIWIGAFNQGAFVINKDVLVASSGKVTAESYYGTSNGTLCGEHVYHIVPDNNGKVWIASNGGIDRIDPMTKKSVHIADEFVSSMLSDSKGRVWTSFENGIHCYDSKGQIVRNIYFAGHDNPVRFVKLLEIDSLIWAITQEDCRVIHPDGKIDIFSLPTINIQTAYYSRDDHKLVLGGMDNIAYIDCKLVSGLNRRQKFMLADIRVNSQNYKSDKAIPYIEKLILKHNENNIEFMLTDIPDSRNVSPKYAYNIKGNGDQWMPLGPDRKITVNGLRYGSYELEVCAVDGLGNRLEKVYSMPFAISAPWYLSVWAKACYCILLALLVWGIRHFYHVRKKLHEEEERRIKILEQQETRSRFFRNLSLEIKKMLAFIIVPAEKVLDSTPSKELKHLTEDIRYSATQINALIRQAFDLNNPKNSIASLHVATIDIVRFCRNFIQVFEERHTEFNSIKYSFQSDTTELRKSVLVVRFDSIFNIIVNYLSRHTQPGGDILMSLKQTADKLVIEVKGYPLNMVVVNASGLFDRYSGLTDSSNEMDNTELYLVREYVTSMDGELQASFSIEQKMLTCGIILPMDSDTQKYVMQSVTSAGDEPDRKQRNRNKTKTVDDKDNEEFLRVVTNTIEKHISDFDFNVSMLQFELNVGEKTLYRRVKQLTGLTPVEYIRHIRMNRAAFLLKEGNFTVSEIMYMVGFSNSGYFSKCFQSIYEITPTKYKRKWKQTVIGPEDNDEQ